LVVLEGEIGINFMDIGGKRIYVCNSCGEKQLKIANDKYIKVRHDIKTRSG
jgi:hypothetical protein